MNEYKYYSGKREDKFNFYKILLQNLIFIPCGYFEEIFMERKYEYIKFTRIEFFTSRQDTLYI